MGNLDMTQDFLPTHSPNLPLKSLETPALDENIKFGLFKRGFSIF